jgi:hypothetical protein
MGTILEGQEIQEGAVSQTLYSLQQVRPCKIKNPGNASFIDFRQNIPKLISFLHLSHIYVTQPPEECFSPNLRMHYLFPST